jgi:nitric oxide reductase NorD protein
VRLDEVANSVGVLFRALGGDGALQVRACEATQHGARRNWLQRVAGSHTTVELAWRDEDTIRLPSVVDFFPQRSLNLELYRWLAAMAAMVGKIDSPSGLPWLQLNQQLTQQILAEYPGLAASYRRLVAAELLLRPDPSSLDAAESALEFAIQQALQQPGSVSESPHTSIVDSRAGVVACRSR